MPKKYLIKVSWQYYWSDLDELDIPHDLRVLLRSIIGNYLNNTIMPDATPYDVRIAKEYLVGGIMIGDRPYEVKVFIPNDSASHRSFFALIPTWSNGQLRHLSEI